MQEQGTNTAIQQFYNGQMFWAGATDKIFGLTIYTGL
jgi:hypothetical protein